MLRNACLLSLPHIRPNTCLLPRHDANANDILGKLSRGNSSTSRSDNQDDCGLILTREPLFAGKAAVLGGVSFVVGYDTAARILNPIYYGGDDGQLLSRITECE